MTKRFLLYSHDTYGLGHFRRNTAIAAALVADNSDAEVLLVSGSPRSGSFSLPPRTDVVQLPSITKTFSGGYKPRRLTGDLDDVVKLRSSVIGAAIRSYRPDAMIVDHAPAGIGGELLPVLRAMSSDPLRPRLVLGLREIIDVAPTVAQQWTRNGAWGALGAYDDLMVYGDERVLSTATELDLAGRLGRPVTHVGYCGPTAKAKDLRRDGEVPLVVVTVGGGGDGHELCHRYLEYLEAKAPTNFRSLIVTGPLMASRRRTELERRACEVAGSVAITTFEPNMHDLLNGADAVVSMGGYNTVVELLAGGIPSLIVPRTSPRMEQQLRAERLGELSHLEWTGIDDLTPTVVERFIVKALGRARESVSVDLNGASHVARILTGNVPKELVANG